MSGQNPRELTLLEYVVLGLISIEPQTGYSIVNFFSPEGIYSWNASPGTIYPILKRLEKQDVIRGKLEMEGEARARKVYTLSPSGETLLDAWLREVPKVQPLYQQREVAMWRFQFMESRLSRPEILRWLNEYQDAVQIYHASLQFWIRETLARMAETGQQSLHRQLILEAILMEVNSLRTWIDMARTRLTMVALQTGEYPAVNEPS